MIAEDSRTEKTPVSEFVDTNLLHVGAMSFPCFVPALSAVYRTANLPAASCLAGEVIASGADENAKFS
jgi:hypothetical protein